MTARRPPGPAPDYRCVACGCTEQEACPGGCAWALVDHARRLGLCTRCEAWLCARPVRAERGRR